MKRVPRADVALSVDWSAIRNAPTIPKSATNTVTIERIVQVPAPADDLPSIKFGSWNFLWDPGTLRPLETVAHDELVMAASPGCPVAVGCPYALDWGQVSAQVVALQTIRIFLTNLALDAITPGAGNWKLVIFFV